MEDTYNFNPEDVIDANERFVPKPSLEPKIDESVSKIVGKKVLLHDPRLITLVRKWKANKPVGSMEPDNFLNDPDKVAELKKVMSEGL